MRKSIQKTYVTAVFVFVIAIAMLLAGCEKSAFTVSQNEDGSITIVAENASEGSEGFSDLELTDKGTLVIQPAFGEEGKIHVTVTEGELTPEDAGEGEPVAEVEISGTEVKELEVGPGKYTVRAEVVSDINGGATIRVEYSKN